ncbi:MAG: glutamine amidotransferase-related protein [Candidatus Saccharimonadota bacterium]
MNFLIIDNGTRHLEELKKLFNGLSYSTVKRSELGGVKVPKDTVVILSGAAPGFPSVLYSDGAYDDEIELIKNHEGPIIGICLGMELIAHAYAMHLHKQKRRIRRLVNVRRSPEPQAAFLPEKFKVFVAHRYSVLHHNGLVDALAYSRSGIEIIKHKTKPIIGLQFHPEVTFGKNNGEKIFKLVLKQIAG